MKHALVAGVTISSLLLAGTPAVAEAARAVATQRHTVIVKMAPGSDTSSRRAALAQGGARLHHSYRSVFDGFSASVSDRQLAALERDPDVLSVTPDGLAWQTDTQADAPWNLDRVDQRQLPLTGSYSYASDGSGVTAFVIDSGIKTSHPELIDRAFNGIDLVDGSGTDCTGHGTHVAGTVGGNVYGVAKRTRLVSVRVIGCSGSASWSTVIAGIDWVISQNRGPAVINLSLAGNAYALMDEAVARATASGFPVVAAAGNHGSDACNYSPARAPAALTVAASDPSDARPAYSNHGSCVDLYAPGEGIRSASSTSEPSTSLKSGTSMAAPHVTGAIARVMQALPGMTTSEVHDHVKQSATPAIVRNAPAAGNALLHLAAVTSGTPPAAPTNFSASREGPTSIRATWSPPLAHGDTPIQGYEVCRTGAPELCLKLDASSREVTFANLRRRTKYEFQARAFNDAGPGPASIATATTR